MERINAERCRLFAEAARRQAVKYEKRAAHCREQAALYDRMAERWEAEVDPDYEHRYREYLMTDAPFPKWRQDPTYDLRRKR